MTISNKTRRDNYDLALRVIMEKLGDGIYNSLIDPELIEFQHVMRTTWEDLERDGLLAKDAGGVGFHYYHLTSHGRIVGLEIQGKLGEPAFRRDLEKLLAAIRSYVDDRLPHSVLPDGIAARAGLSPIFVGNVLETKLLEREFPKDLVDVEWRGWNKAVTIPGGFGRKKPLRCQLHITTGTGPIRQVEAETDIGPAQVGWPDSISGRLLDFHKEDWVGLFERTTDGTVTVHHDVTVSFRVKRYKFTRLESDGTFELTKDRRNSDS